MSAQSWLTPNSGCNVNLTQGAPSLGITAAPRNKHSSTPRPENMKLRQGAVPQEAVILEMLIIDIQLTVRKGVNDIFESFSSKTVGRN